MSTIDLDRQILRNFNQMQPGIKYQMTDRIWAEYQGLRVKNGWGRTEDANQNAWVFERRTNELWFQNQKVFDFAAWEKAPWADSLALALAVALAFAFAFAPVTLAFALACKPLGSPDPPCLSPSPISDFDNLLHMMPGIEGSTGGFWNERTKVRVAGARTNESWELHLRNLTEEKLARILRVVEEIADQ